MGESRRGSQTPFLGGEEGVAKSHCKRECEISILVHSSLENKACHREAGKMNLESKY